MSRYLIESPHTKEECLQALDEIVERDPELLEKYDFACMSGEHVGWTTVEASSKAEALEKVPAFLRDKARVIEVGRFTAEQVRSFHEK